ncbi:kinase-like domain-containing protein [Syncephalis pseudoplumigaleata]|uniref:Kinase-like domain-containing protein n=1 Tax=Syncephalis pseudoplumigaleata TaxID=1712513 RepID=A0A4P9YVQ9_9FUNG|nr:kinase-like domain-containing protein [Syncephalis pseudoplumigaleata]|eukprot:RKP23010.1 kinase-like domain-containing protein [Syncephalis pseudoplumigaleata]
MVVGGYALGPELGSGAFGQVYKGLARKTGRVVAIKETARSAEGIKEWDVMSLVSGHAHVVQAIELIEHAQRVFYILEYAHGGDLFTYAKRYGFKLPEEDVRTITRQIVAALQHINARGVAHFDLKPANVLFRDAEHSHILLADFGAAKLLDKPDRLFTRPAGTVQYMAPEVLACYHGAEDAAGEDVPRGFSKLADNWSLGILVHVLLHGCFPFALHKDEQTTPLQHIRAQLKAILARRQLFIGNCAQSPCSTDVQDFINRLLEISPARRMTLAEARAHPWLRGAQASKHGRDDSPAESSSAQGGKRPRLG